MEEVFEPAKRAIFKYADGSGKTVCGDPLVILGKTKTAALARGTTIDALIETSNKVDVKGASDIEVAAAWNALDILADISRESFTLVPFDPETGAGADMAHALGVLNVFHRWLEKKNQTPDWPLTSFPSVASIQATQPTMDTSSV